MEMNAAKLSPEQQRKRLELVIEGTRLGMWDWNPQTNEVAFNDIWAQMLGHELSDITPALEEWESRVHPDDIAGCYADIQAHMEGKTDFYENVHRMKHRDGHWVYILDRGKIVEWDEKQNPVRFTGTHTDVSKQKIAEEAALKSAKAKSQFLANMSHEIRTPLTGILGVVELLKKTTLDERQLEFTEIVCECSEGLLSTLNDILDLSKLETGKMTFSPHIFEVPKVMLHSCQLFKDQALRKGLEFIVDISNTQGSVVADSNRLRQVMGNIISNAIKFTEKGFVKLSTNYIKNKGNVVSLEVRISDSGCGIANLSRVWNSFEQDDDSVASHYGGTGLGLTISKELMELMAGSITVKSQPGKGSEFVITLPVEISLKAPNEPESKATASKAISNLNILIAEDNTINQLIISEFLEEINAQFSIVENGEEAVKACERDEYDLIFMDLHMPKLSGINATKNIRTLPNIMQPSIYALTADAMSDVNQECIAVGMQGVLHKPFDNEKLLEVINRVCSKK